MSASAPARRDASGNDVPSGRVFRLGLAALLLLLALPAAADAYTLVLRSGRRVTVPDDFKVTQAAVIYEASPGFSVTVWLSNVDVAATERANAEPAGSFAGRIRQEPQGAARPPAPEASRSGRRGGGKVITNRELEPSRLRRQAQEEEYERTRRERGLPSKQELQARAEEQERRLHELARQVEAERREAELEALQSELVNVRRQLNELSLHLSPPAADSGPAHSTPDYYPYLYAPPAQFVTVLPFGHRGGFGRGHFAPRSHGRRPVHSPGWGFAFPPAHARPSRHGGTPRWAPPPAMRPPRR